MKKRPKADSVDWLTIKLFLKAARHYKPAFYFIWLTPISAICLSIVIPFFIGRILAALAHPHASVAPAVTGLIIGGIVGIIGNRIAFQALLSLQARAMAYLQTEAVEHLLHRGTSFHNNTISGKLTSDALDYANAFLKFSDSVMVQALPFITILITGISLVAATAPLIGLTVLLMSILAIGSGVLFRIMMTPYRHERLVATKAVTAHIADTITNNQTVKSFGREDYELAIHRKLNDTLRDFRLRDWGKLAANGSNRIMGLFSFELVFIAVTIRQIHQHPQLLGAGIFAFSYTVTLTNRLFDIGNMMRGIEESLLQAEPMTRLLQQPTEVQDKPKAQRLLVNKGTVTLKNIDFHYSDSSQNEAVFRGLTLQVSAGEKIGLVGPSGGGKSSLTKLLLRFEDINGGEILIDDQNIANITQQSLHQSISYVSQEPLLFHRSIKDNITYGKPTARESEIKAAAHKAYALEFIETLPQQFNTIVGERGVKLSGGQRQRIAIARAILKDAPILVLDEATSALDSESERVIQRALWKLMEHKTSIVIAHRLSTIQKMDRIIVLDEGKIVEQGSHHELLAHKGLYAKLWAHQSGGFIEE